MPRGQSNSKSTVALLHKVRLVPQIMSLFRPVSTCRSIAHRGSAQLHIDALICCALILTTVWEAQRLLDGFKVEFADDVLKALKKLLKSKSAVPIRRRRRSRSYDSDHMWDAILPPAGPTDPPAAPPPLPTPPGCVQRRLCAP
jgi:hypothetical protein